MKNINNELGEIHSRYLEIMVYEYETEYPYQFSELSSLSLIWDRLSNSVRLSF